MKIACITPDNKRDYLCETILEGLVDLGIELIVSDPGNGVVTKRLEDNDFVTQASMCDAAFAFFGKVRNNTEPRHQLLSRIKLPKKKKAYIDGSEWRADGWDTPRQVVDSLDDPRLRRGEPWINGFMWEKCGHYFKRECWPQDVSQFGVKPLPFAMCKRHLLEQKPKDIDILCSFGHHKTGLRRDVVEACENLKRESNLNIVVRAGMPQHEYKDVLSRSRLVIDSWGGGDTTDRFWEGIGAGACVLYQRHNVLTPNSFVDWKHAVSYTTVSEMTNSINRLFFGRSDELDNIAHAGLEHAMCYHTAKERAKFIIDTVLA